MHLRSLHFVPALAAAAILAVGCADSNPVVGPAEEPAAAVTNGAASAVSAGNSFVILGNGNKLPRNLERDVAAAGGTIESTIPQIGVAIVSSENPDFTSAIAGARGVQEVGRDRVIQWIDPDLRVIEAEPTVDDPPFSGDDDFFFDLQWGHDAIDAVESRTAGFTGAGVRIAILDSGIDETHPDIAPNLNAALSESFIPGEDVFIGPGVYFNHGTHVAGIAAAADNGVGVVGVAPEAEIVAVKVLSEITGTGSFAGVAAGIVHAADIDADIINMSLGGVIPAEEARGSGVAALVNMMKRAVRYAYQSGATIIAAAGNDAIDRDHDANTLVLPADLPHVISVSATAPELWGLDLDTDLDVPAHYTNFGQSAIDFSAPGGDFDQAFGAGLMPCVIGPFFVGQCVVGDFVISASSESWFFAAGTSMAAPHVAGVAALIIGANGGEMKPQHVEQALRQSADDLGKSGNDDFHGGGRVNAARAVGLM